MHIINSIGLDCIIYIYNIGNNESHRISIAYLPSTFHLSVFYANYNLIIPILQS